MVIPMTWADFDLEFCLLRSCSPPRLPCSDCVECFGRFTVGVVSITNSISDDDDDESDVGGVSGVICDFRSMVLPLATERFGADIFAHLIDS